MKNLSLLATLLFVAAFSFAQSVDTNWTRQYDSDGTYRPVEIAATPNGNYLISQNGIFYEIDNEGNLIDTANLGQWVVLHSASSNNGVLIAGIVQGAPTVSKLSASFDQTWTIDFPSIYGRASALLVDGDDYYTCGNYAGGNYYNFISKFNDNGDTAWTLKIPRSTFSNLTSLIKLSDGNFLASGNLDDYPIAIKFNSIGDTIWTFYEPIFISFGEMSAFERSNGEIVLIAERHMVVLDDDGTKISDEKFTKNDYFDIALDEDYVYLLGRNYDMQNALVEVRNYAMDSLTIYHYDIDEFSQFFSVEETAGGGFIGVGVAADTVTSINNRLLAVKFNDVPVGVKSVVRFGIMQGYPNPAMDEFTIESSEPLGQIEVYNVAGQLVHSQRSNANKVDLNISEWEVGSYIIKSEAGLLQMIKQ